MKRQYYRRGQCGVCGKTAERQLFMTREEYDLWMTMAIVHKRCEAEPYCRFCGYELTPENELEDYETHPWGACTGIQTKRVNPFKAEIHDEVVEELFCPGGYDKCADDI